MAPRYSIRSLGVPRAERPRPLVRELSLADLITLGNGACGTAAILLCMASLAEPESRAIGIALALMPLALLFDALDGVVARWRHRHSPFGADLDSLADIVSFGVAPAAIGFTLGLRGTWDAAILVFFVGCGIARLARFNATSDERSDERGKVPYFVGTPIPSSMLLVLLLAVLLRLDLVGDDLWLGHLELWGHRWHPLSALFALNGLAMVSSWLRIPKP